MSYPSRTKLVSEFKSGDNYDVIASRLSKDGYVTKRGKRWEVNSVAYTFKSMGLKRNSRTTKKVFKKKASRTGGKLGAVVQILKLKSLPESERIALALMVTGD